MQLCKNVKHFYNNLKDDVQAQQLNQKYKKLFYLFRFYIFVLLQTAARKQRTHASLKTKRLSGVNLIKTTKTQKVGNVQTTTITKTSVSTKSS